MFSLYSHVVSQFNAYAARFPEEHADLSQLRQQLETELVHIFDRSNMSGHVTTSALVYDKAEDVILTIWHNGLQRELQPGGHQEGNCPLYESADRETTEETGYRGAVLHPWHLATGAPLDIETHSIPARASNGEGAHLHHDFIYLFSGDSSKALTPQLAEVKDPRWIPRARFRELHGVRMARLVRKLEHVHGLER